jgi:hypothetical protein
VARVENLEARWQSVRSATRRFPLIAPRQYELPLVEKWLLALASALAELDVLSPVDYFVSLLGLGTNEGSQRATDIYPKIPTLPAHLGELLGARVHVVDLRRPPVDLAGRGVAPMLNAIGEEESHAQFRVIT